MFHRALLISCGFSDAVESKARPWLTNCQSTAAEFTHPRIALLSARVNQNAGKRRLSHPLLLWHRASLRTYPAPPMTFPTERAVFDKLSL